MNDPLIPDFIAAAETYYQETNRGELATMHGDVAPHLSPSQKKEIVELVKRREQLGFQILQRCYLGR